MTIVNGEGNNARGRPRTTITYQIENSLEKQEYAEEDKRQHKRTYKKRLMIVRFVTIVESDDR